ncbi:hypothetical protein GGC63_003001 [Paenibacillus sp. OAS669]|nr:hypothetical protein [Paenibacillus sp. OAS669]
MLLVMSCQAVWDSSVPPYRADLANILCPVKYEHPRRMELAL